MPLSLKDIRPDRGFREATMADAGMLYAWRIEAELAVDYPRPTTYEAHLSWLRDRLDSPLVRILIWNDDEGMIRIDSNGELAFWGGSPGMLEAAAGYAGDYGGRLKVTVNEDDIGGVAALKNAGFVEYPVRFLAYKP